MDDEDQNLYEMANLKMDDKTSLSSIWRLFDAFLLIYK